MSNPVRYNRFQAKLHWAIAILVLLMLIMGTFVLQATPNDDPLKLVGLKGHMIVGVVVLLLTLTRIIVRMTKPQPLHVTTGNIVLDKVAVITHKVLIGLTVLMALSGIGIAVQADLFNILFNNQGALPENFDAIQPRIAHGILAKLFAALVALHILAGLFHQFVLKDKIYSRLSVKK